MAPHSFTLSLEESATPLPVAPGATIVVRGSLYSRYDGSVIDAATTTWPAGAPGGASVDAGGLIDFGAGGFEIVARDAADVGALAEDWKRSGLRGPLKSHACRRRPRPPKPELPSSRHSAAVGTDPSKKRPRIIGANTGDRCDQPSSGSS